MVSTRRKLDANPVPAKGFSTRSPFLDRLLAALLAAAIAACGEGPRDGTSDARSGASGEGAEPPAPAAFELPETPPTDEARIAWFLSRIASGDPEEEAWAGDQLRRAGAAARPAVRAALADALDRDPETAERLLGTEGLFSAEDVDLLVRAAASASGRVRRAAARALGGLPPPAGRTTLADLVADPSHVVASEAIAAFRRRGAAEAAAALRGRFPVRVARDVESRVGALQLVADGLAGEERRGFLAGLLETTAGELRIAAAARLAALGDERGVAALAPEVGAADPARRLAALELLAAAGGVAAAPPLVELARSADASVAVAAIAALGRLSLAARGELADLAGAGRPEVRREALHALLKLGDEEALASALARLDGRPEERRWAAQLLGSALATSAAEPLAARMARESELGIRRDFAAALQALGGPAGSAEVARLLLDEPEAQPARALTAWNAAEALLGFRSISTDARALLREGLSGPGAGVRLNAARVLGRHGDGPADAAALASLLADPIPAVRAAAAAAYARRPEAEVAPLLAAHRAESDPHALDVLRTAARMVYYRWRP